MSEARKILTIATIERRNNDREGNPQFRITFTDASSALTAANSQVNYRIENREYRNVPLVVTFNSNGRITRVTVADQPGR